MKQSIKTTFTIIGSVIGAGFISGKELVRFYGGQAFVPFLAWTGILFFAYLLFLLRVGKRFNGFNGYLEAKLKTWEKIVRGIFLVCSFISVVAMLAGINALEENFSPYIAVVTAIFCAFSVKKGVAGIGTVNLVLVPFIVGYIAVCLFQKGEFSFSGEQPSLFWGTGLVLIYAAMNIVLSAPVVMDCGRELSGNGQIVCISIFSSIVITFCIGLVLSAVAATDGAAEKTMPLLYVLSGDRFFALISYFGIVTTLVSSYYPLHTVFEGRKRKRAARAVTLAAACGCSLLGLSSIVNYLYPVMGVFGAVFLAFVIFNDELFRQRYEKVHDARQKT